MSCDPASFFAKWIKKMKKIDIKQATRFANAFRFIDDLSALNDGGEI